MPQPKKHASARRRRNTASTAATLTDRRAEDRSSWTVKELREEIDRRNDDGRHPADYISKSGNKAALVAALAEADLGVPPLPDRREGWHVLTEKWWASVWSSPMSEEWHLDTDFYNVLAAAVHHDDIWMAPDAGARQRAHTAFLKTIAPLGLTPYDRRRLEWTIEQAEGAKAAGRRREQSGQGKPAAPAPPKGADPRLSLVQ